MQGITTQVALPPYQATAFVGTTDAAELKAHSPSPGVVLLAEIPHFC